MNRAQGLPSDLKDMRRELQSLSRKDLQTLAKQEGVKANMSSASIVEELLRLASDAPVPTWPQPESSTSRPHKGSYVPSFKHAQPASDKQSSIATGASKSSRTPRSDTGNTADQAPSVSTHPAANLHTRPAAARASAEGSKSGNECNPSSGRRKWQVPASPTKHSVSVEQPLHQQIETLSLSPRRRAPVTQCRHTAAVVGTTVPNKPEVQSLLAPQQLQKQQMVQQAHLIHQHNSRSSSLHMAARGQQIAKLPAVGSAAVPQHPQQQVPTTAVHTPVPQKLHTPMRVRVKDSAAARQALPYQKQIQVKGAVALTTQANTAAVTPIKQRVGAFSKELQTNPQPIATPIRATAAAPAAAAAASPISSTVGAAVPDGLMSPRLAVMGSARRVVPTQSRLGSIKAADSAAVVSGLAPGACKGGPQLTAAAAVSAGTASAAAGPPPTPLQKGARRAVPVEEDQQLRLEDQQLEALVQRCLRIRDPDAPQTVLSGPEPAKWWLQQHIIAPLQRAQPPPTPAGQTDGRRVVGPAANSSSSCCMAAGFCHKALLLYGPTGSGKTELVHALASEMNANLLYVPAGDVLKTYQEQGHRLLRALFKVACRVAPSVICFDDAHRSFPADARLSNPNHPSHKMLVELTVQLQQLADMQVQLQERLRHGSSKSSTALVQPAQPKVKKPAWGLFSSSKKQQQRQDATEETQQGPQQQKQQSGCQQLAGPVVVVFASRHPEALDPSLLPLLHTRLLLDLPSLESREDMLMAWLMAKEAAVGVQDVEQLARRTEGFSCTDLLQLCQEAAIRPLQERSHRAVCMRDFEAAFQKVRPSVPAQRRAQLRAWMNS